jgi:hypothetical protein
MINAFNLCRSLATKHEDAIGAAILLKVRSGRPAIERREAQNCSSKKARYYPVWEARGKKVLAYVKKHPGCDAQKMARDFGMRTKSLSIWLEKMRRDGDVHGFFGVKDPHTRLYYYFPKDQK